MRPLYLILSLLVSFCAKAQPTFLLAQNFNSTPTGWTLTNNSVGGNAAAAAWTLQPDGYTFSDGFLTETFHSNDNSGFIITNSALQGNGTPIPTTDTRLQSPAFNTQGYSTLTLSFYHYFNFNFDPDRAYVEVSTNGTTWTTVKVFGNDGLSVGSSTSFAHEVISLNGFTSQNTVYVRFRYVSEYGYYWAIDNVTVLGTVAGSLPVSFSKFTGSRKANQFSLQWTTEWEQDNKEFIIEHSTDGRQFSEAGRVASKAPNGSSSGSLNYVYDLSVAPAPHHFFRLKQVDRNGNSKYSAVIMITGDNGMDAQVDKVYPNPVISKLTLGIQAALAQDVKVELIDLGGRTIYEKNTRLEKGANQLSLPMEHIRSGLYLLRTSNSSGLIDVRQITRQ